VVERYRQRLPALRIVDASARKGAAHARNVGAAAACGDALLFCDADDEVAPGWLEAMGRALERHDLVAGTIEFEKLNDTSLCPQRPVMPGVRRYDYLPWTIGANLGVKHAIHDAIGGFDEALLRAEDVDYCWKIQRAGFEFHSVPDALIHYRYRPTLRLIYEQHRAWGEAGVILYKRYRPLGMPRAPWSRIVKDWARLLWHLPQLAREDKRVRWVRRFAKRVGRLQGCIKYRVMAP
jgi:GT2 family glycosyltransferase